MKALLSRAERTVPSGPETSLLPIGVLSAIYLVDQLDTIAFGVLAPEIKATFHLSTAAFGGVIALNFLVLISLGLVVGWLGDRFNRVLIVRLGLLLAGIGSVFTGLAPVVGALIFFRVLNGAGVVVSGPVHRSLISDYYPPERRASLFGIHEGAERLSGLVGPLAAAAIGSVFGWRAAFLVFAVPIGALLVVSVRLREPLRGGMDDADAATAASDEAPPRLARVGRILANVPTLRRTWVALVFLGAGFIPVASFLPLFMDSVFGVGIFARGLLGVASATAALCGLWAGSRYANRHIASSPGRVQVVAGLAFVAMGALFVALATSASVAAAAAVSVSFGFLSGVFAPMLLTVQALVYPPKGRGVGFAFSGLFLAVGVFIAPLAGGIADRNGLRFGVIAFAPLVAIGGALLASAGRFVKADAARALATLEAAAELSRERRSLKTRQLLVCRGLNVGYSGTQVLFDVDFDVEEGEAVALLGTNGAGKSTLLKAIVGLAPPTTGMIFFDGHEISGVDAADAAERGIALMPGGRAVFPTLSVRENLKVAAWQHRGDAAVVEARTAEVLELFGVLETRADQPAGNLSGGEQQMLALAQTLIAKPRLVMIDELTLGLAPVVIEQLFPVVQKIKESGVTLILVEQSVNLALSLADRAFFMEKGEIRFHGPTSELLERRDLLRSVFLEGAASAMTKRADSNGARRARR